ncbi:response regulator receiver protein [Crinalium epipsammum PCC 9333]|uniref:Response regulator receiver protein n=1 Tax=Crinalium epipsammum PCC 9333 TaxID=1173022 RepID=K9W012_9CYAN|nr:response regulator [Crinalium epipsammum]AFZ13077.1 response regulator receiver protein [Crinalium epipsammum PCC 9333]
MDIVLNLSLKILLAEDNVINQKVASQMLKQLGLKADLATNGLEVLDALRHQQYDVVLMDVQMPEMDGIEATRQIRQEWNQENSPWIIAVTANTIGGVREECLNVGMNDFISKPLNKDVLMEALSKCPASTPVSLTVNEQQSVE